MKPPIEAMTASRMAVRPTGAPRMCNFTMEIQRGMCRYEGYAKDQRKTAKYIVEGAVIRHCGVRAPQLLK